MSSKLLGGLSRRAARPRPNDRAQFQSLLRRKGWLLQDVEKHPVCLGVPLGRNGGSESAISVDVGLKNMVQVSSRGLAGASAQYKRALLDRMKGGAKEGEPETFGSADLVPMRVVVKEDIQRLPVATPVHPAALARRVPDEILHALQDPFFNAGAASQELAKVIVDAVPDADLHQTVMREHRKEQERERLPPSSS